MSINYSSILSRAWTIAWKYKILWIFGFLAMLGSGGTGWNGGSAFRGPSYNFGPSDVNRSNLPPEWKSFFDQLALVSVNTWIDIAVGVFCCLILLAVVFWILSIIGRGGLIGGIVKADSSGSVTFREAWSMGLRTFWRLFLIRLLNFGLSIALAVVIFLPGAIIGVLTCGIGFIPLICVGFLVGVAMSLWFLLMDYAVVVENLRAGEAIGRAWNILRDRIGPAIILFLILFAVSLGLGLAMLIVFAPAGVLIFLSLLPLITQSGSLNVALLLIGLILLLAAIVVSIVVNSIYEVWKAGVWTFAYQAFIGQPQPTAVAAVNPPPAPTATA